MPLLACASLASKQTVEDKNMDTVNLIIGDLNLALEMLHVE